VQQYWHDTASELVKLSLNSVYTVISILGRKTATSSSDGQAFNRQVQTRF